LSILTSAFAFHFRVGSINARSLLSFVTCIGYQSLTRYSITLAAANHRMRASPSFTSASPCDTRSLRRRWALVSLISPRLLNQELPLAFRTFNLVLFCQPLLALPLLPIPHCYFVPYLARHSVDRRF
jgi:hypothetical protein